jgi:hypothetical protein
MSGFGGHDPGRVRTWDGGRLSFLTEQVDRYSWPRAEIGLQPTDPIPPDTDAAMYAHESTFLSSDPRMRTLQPRVAFIAVAPR